VSTPAYEEGARSAEGDDADGVRRDSPQEQPGHGVHIYEAIDVQQGVVLVVVLFEEHRRPFLARARPAGVYRACG
jgi:hypothetical protein